MRADPADPGGMGAAGAAIADEALTGRGRTTPPEQPERPGETPRGAQHRTDWRATRPPPGEWGRPGRRSRTRPSPSVFAHPALSSENGWTILVGPNAT